MLSKNLKIILVQLLVVLAGFSLARLVFLGWYWSLFNDYSLFQIAGSVIHGVRFDLVAVLKTLGFVFLLRMILGNWAFKTFFPGLLTLASLLVIWIYIILFLIDLGYFELINRHISFDLYLVLHEAGGAAQQVLSDYSLFLVLFLVLTGSLFWGWFKLNHRLNQSKVKKTGFKKQLLFFPVFLLIFLLGARGGLQEMPIIETLAFKGKPPMLGHLSLSAPYTVVRLFEQDQIEPLNLLPEDEAVQRTRKLLGGNSDYYISQDYPVMRNSLEEESAPLKKNVVLVVLESWPSVYMGAYNPENKEVTPHFDKLAKEGLLFTRFWANGHYTTHGIGAIIGSIPTLPDITVVSSSFFGNKFQTLPGILKNHGYNSLFLQGFREGSSKIDYFMETIGVDKVITQSDFKDFKGISNIWGIWDEFTYQRFSKEIGKLKEPYLAIVHNATTHTPHQIPSDKWKFFSEKVPGHQFKNTLRYSDAALGQFFETMKETPEYKNTLFIITADHTVHTRSDQLADRARIPLLIIDPSGEIPKGISNTVGMQTDILPTILDVLNIQATHASAGSSLFKKTPENEFAIHYTGDFVYWIEKDTLTSFVQNKPASFYNLKKDWKTEKNLLEDTDISKIQKNMHSYLQVFQNAIFYNKLMR